MSVSGEKVAKLLKRRQNINTPGYEFKEEDSASEPRYEWEEPMNDRVQKMLDKRAKKWYKPYEAKKQIKDDRTYREFGTENVADDRKTLALQSQRNAQNKRATQRFADALEKQRMLLQPSQTEEEEIYQLALDKAMESQGITFTSRHGGGGRSLDASAVSNGMMPKISSVHSKSTFMPYSEMASADDYEQYIAESEKTGTPASPNMENSFDNHVNTWKNAKYSDHTFIKMTDDERDMYNYLWGKYGAEKAEEFVKSLDNDLNMRHADDLFNTMEKVNDSSKVAGIAANTFLAAGINASGAAKGVTTRLLDAVAGNDEPEAYDAGELYLDQLRGNRSGAEKVVYDVAGSVGNMIPPMLVGAASPNAGKVMFGLSAAGNAYENSIREGKSKEEARLYGAVNGIMEGATNALLGGVGKIGGGIASKTIAKTGAAKAANTALQKIVTSETGRSVLNKTLSFVARMGDEALEEYVQELGDKAARNIIFGENNKISVSDPDAWYAAFLGALTAGVLNIPSAIVESSHMRNQSIDPSMYESNVGYNSTELGKDLDPEMTDTESSIKGSFEDPMNEETHMGSKYQEEKSIYPENTLRLDSVQKMDTDPVDQIMKHAGTDQLRRQATGSEVPDNMSGSKPEVKIEDYAKQFGDFGNKAFEKNYTPDIPMDVYDKGFKDAYNAGRYNEDYRTVNTAAFNALPGDAGIRAFEAGLADRNKALNIDLKTGKPKTGGLQEASQTASEGMKNAAEQLGKKTGLKFIITDSLPYDANGMYEGKTGQVYISTNTENFNSTVSHELTHFIRDYAPESYQSYQDIVARSFAESQSTELEAMIGAYADNYAKTGKMTRDEIMDEIVADATANFMNDEEFIGRIADQDKTLAQKIVDFFTDLVDSIKTMIKRNTDSRVASVLEENLSNYETARNLWYDALEEASRKNKSGMEVESETKYQLVGVDENGIETYETNEDTKKLSMAERKKLLLDTILDEYVGRTAKFTKDGTSYYAILDKKGLRKGVYGDKKSDSRGFETKINIGADGNYFELLENALYSGSEADSGKETSNHAHVGVASWDYYVKTIKSDGNYYSVLINVRNKGNGQYVYDVSLRRKQSPQAARPKPAFNQGDSVSSNIISEDGSKSNTDFQLKGFSEEVYNELLKKYGAIEKGVNPVRDIKVPKQTGDKDKVRQTVRTILESDTITDDMVDPIQEKILDGSLSYQSVSDDSAKAYADTMMKNGFDYAMRKWEQVVNGDRPASKNDIALAERLLKDAAQAGDTKTVLKLTSEIAAEGTRAGQTVQAMAMMKNLKEAGIAGEAKYFLDVENDLNKDLEKRFKYKKEQPRVKLNEELVDKLNYVETDLEREAVYGEIFQDLADQLPTTWVDKWNAWRYLSMLGNPRTHIRNIVGNGIFVPAVEMKNAIGAHLESKIIKDGERTKASRIGKEYKEFAKKDFENVKEKISAGGKMNPTNEVTSRRKIFKTRWLEFFRTGNTNMLEKEDAVFLNYHYNRALSGYLQANNVNLDSITDTQLEKARMYAIHEAQKATYRDASAVAEKIQQISNTNMATQFLVEGVLPFKKTPINILKRGVEYSPAGLLATLTKGVNDLNTGKISQNQFIDGVSSGLTGTVIMAVGMLLTQLGFIRGAYDDEDEKNLGKLTGDQEYSVKIGQYTYTIDWTAPASLPLFVGCEVAAALNGEYDQVDVATILDAMSSITEPMFNLSMLSGLNDTIEAVSFSGNKLEALGKEAVFSYLGQVVPTFAGQVARTIDPYQRTVKTDKNSWMPTDAQYFIKKQFNKIPFVSYLNEPRLDDYGQIPENGNYLTRIMENMVSPGFIEKSSEDEVYGEVKRLYDETGEGSAVLNTRKNNFTIDGEKVYMKPEEFTKYRQLAGGMSYNMLQDLNSRDFYEDLDAYEQLDIVGDIYSYAKDTAKKETIGYELKGWQEKAAEYAASGGDALDYIIFRNRTMDLTGDVDKKGHTVSGSVKKKVLEQIDSMDISKEQKDLLYELKGYGQKELKDAPWH